jgi:serine/threonine protein kinase
MALLGKLIADKYRVEELIGESSFGSLYRGTNTLLDKPVAIGVGGDNFLDRAKAAAKISHPNLLNLNDLGTEGDGTAYAIYESAPGETLSEALGREGQLPVEMALDIARQAGAGLSAAHAAGLIHGDLSPANVIVSSSEPGRVGVKVFGFGAENALHDGSTDPARFAYLAPEQCSGAEHSDNRGDVYSLGVLLYQALAGATPFVGETASDMMMRQIEEPPPPLSSFRTDLPAWLEPVILQAMAKNPDSRYQTVDALVNDLANASTVPTAVAATAEGANNLWKTAFVVLAGISLLTIGLIYMTYSRQTDPTTALQPDANGMPVQPINPATGVEEQNLSSLPPEFSYDANTNTMVPTTGAVPGDSGNPWLNGNNPPPGGAPIAPGGQVIQVPLGGSPFMSDPNCIPQPSGIMLCTVPVTPTPAPKVSPTPRTPANSNTNTTPAATPAPARTPTPRPANTPARPASTPASGTGDANSEID